MSICLVYWRNQILYLYTAPLTLETRHLINSETIELMKCGSMLINTARGALIDTGAAVNALKRRDRLWYLGIDVYEEKGPLFFTDLSSTIIQDDVFERCANVGAPASTIRPPFGERANAVTARSISSASRASPHGSRTGIIPATVAKIAKPIVETSVKVRQNLEKFVWSSREK
jgi:lactate dehydrogenase-like 2-hydroxyacid dehydrogenase